MQRISSPDVNKNSGACRQARLWVRETRSVPLFPNPLSNISESRSRREKKLQQKRKRPPESLVEFSKGTTCFDHDDCFNVALEHFQNVSTSMCLIVSNRLRMNTFDPQRFSYIKETGTTLGPRLIIRRSKFCLPRLMRSACFRNAPKRFFAGLDCTDQPPTWSPL